MVKKKFSLKPIPGSISAMAKMRFFQISGIVAFIFLALSVFLPIWRLFPEITEEFAIPLHYNIHSGVDSFGPWQRIFTIPIIGGVILFVNTIAAVLFWKKDKVLSYFFFGVASVAQVLLFGAMIFVVLLNLSYV